MWGYKVCVPYTLPYYFLQQVVPVDCDVKVIDVYNGKISGTQIGKSLENQNEEFEPNVGGTEEPLKVLERKGKFIKFAL